MGKLDAAVKDAANEAIAEMGLVDDPEEGLQSKDEGTDAPASEATPDEAPAPTSGSEEEEQDVEPDTDPVPTELFGVDLSQLPEPERKTFIREWTEQNKHISKLQRELAEKEEAPPAPAPPAEPEPEPEPITDDILAQALRLDLEDPDDARLAERLIPLARMNLELKDQLQQVSTTVQTDAESRYWTGELDSLEARFGPLPIERAAVLEKAAEKGIADPEAAYWLAAGPVRQSVMDGLKAAIKLQTADGKKAATTPRPKTTAPATQQGLESKTTKDAVREAAELAAEELGFDWEDARRKSIGLD